jgi:hypothetical protein
MRFLIGFRGRLSKVGRDIDQDRHPFGSLEICSFDGQAAYIVYQRPA